MNQETRVDPINKELLKSDGKVIRGKNGRLFLANDTNETLKQYAGEVVLSDRQLRDWRLVLENRIGWLQSLGISYFFFLPPDPHWVYPEDLPDTVRSGFRPLEQLLRHLEDERSFSRIIYPLDDLLAAKPNPLLYAKTDAHWSAYGAYVGYRRLAGEIASTLPLHIVEEDDVSYQEKPWLGSLGFKVEPKEESIQVTARVRRPVARLVSDNCLFDKGMMVVTECEEAPPITCVVFGDSYAIQLHPFLAASFRRLVFVTMPTIAYELVRREQPDLVITVNTEHQLTRVPYDFGPRTMTLEAWAERGRAMGYTRDELDFWPRADSK